MMWRFPSLVLTVLAVASEALAVSTFKPARPPAVPLAVKSPYLSTWLNVGSTYGNGGYLAGQWPVHWSQQNTGWSGLIRVDDQVYQWMGDPAGSLQGNTNTGWNGTGIPNVDQASFEYTSTKSIFQMRVGTKLQMTITFLSPIYPNDYKRQSLQFSYMDVSVRSLDGAEHKVQLYTDISAEWASGDHNTTAEWDYGAGGGLGYHKVFKQEQLEFDENNKPSGNGMANWGYVYYATDMTDKVTKQSGADVVVRNAFMQNGTLDNSADTNFRFIQQEWPVFAYAVDMGNVGSLAVSQLFTIGLLQKNSVQFARKEGIVPMPSLWTAYFKDEVAALEFFHKDWSEAQKAADGIDSKVQDDSVKVAGQDYATINSLVVRQAFGSWEFVGTEQQPLIFLKEISSNGNTQTIDVVFPMHPILDYFNPALLKLLLDPMYEYQESGLYPNKYSIHDLGANFPNATGHPKGDDEEMPVEECGNMLIMTLSYGQRNNDVDYLKQHYPILDQWTQYLVNDSLIPAEQLSTDDFAGRLVNQTNLALKGIVGIRAMGEIARLVGQDADADKYNKIAYDYVEKWMVYGNADGANPPHTTLNYNNHTTWGLLYNLWGDLELGLKLIPQKIYDQQSAFYPTVENRFGVPLDTRGVITKADWMMFMAACSSTTTRDMFIHDLATWINETPTGKAFTDLYDTQTGNYPGFEFIARPVMGGTFSLLLANAQEGSGLKCGECAERPPDLRRRYKPELFARDLAGEDGMIGRKFRA